MGLQLIQGKNLCYDLLPVQYTELTLQLRKFLSKDFFAGAKLELGLPDGSFRIQTVIIWLFFLMHWVIWLLSSKIEKLKNFNYLLFHSDFYFMCSVGLFLGYWQFRFPLLRLLLIPKLAHFKRKKSSNPVLNDGLTCGLLVVFCELQLYWRCARLRAQESAERDNERFVRKHSRSDARIRYKNVE